MKLLIFAVLLTIQPAFGSIVLAGIDENHIIVATDSRRDLGKGRYESACKLAVGDRFIFAAVGLDRYDEHCTTYDIAQRAASPSRSLEQIADSWADQVSNALPNSPYLGWMWRFSFTGQPATIGIFAGFADSEAEIIVERVFCDPENKHVCKLERTKEILRGDQGMRWFSWGATDISYELLAGNTPLAQETRAGWVETLKSSGPAAMDLQIITDVMRLTKERSRFRALIGGPTDIVEFNRNASPRWIQQKSICKGKTR